jgi:hypothetical protein
LRTQGEPTNRSTEKHKSIDRKRIVHVRAVDIVCRGKGQVDRDVNRPNNSVYINGDRESFWETPFSVLHSCSRCLAQNDSEASVEQTRDGDDIGRIQTKR